MLLRWLQGYVNFEATGGFTERFLNLCKVNNINLWNVQNNGVKVIAFTTIKEFKMLDTCAENSGMSISEIKSCGLKLLVLRHKWRFGVFVGMMLICFFIFIMSGRVWSVESVPINGVKSDNFTQRVEKCGIKKGMKIKDIDYIAIENELLFNYSDVSWVSVNILGAKVRVEYTLLKKQTPSPDTEQFTNIVASKAGKITLVQCYRGTKVVKENVFVPKGTLLISGIVQNGDLSESLTHASGKVFARTENNCPTTTKKKFVSQVTQKEKSLYCINFFGFSIPLGKANKSDEFNNTEIMLEGNGNVLPVGINRIDYIVSNPKEISLNVTQCDYINLLDCICEKRNKYKNAKLEKISYKTTQSSEKISLTQTIICIEDIALEQKGYVE